MISVNPINSISQEAKNTLKNGELLQTTEKIALQMSNNYDFARRIAQEASFIFAGQAIKHLDVGHKVRAYSHFGILAPPGIGKDFAWDLIEESGIFPTDQIKATRLDNVTEAALSGTIFENTIVPPPTVTHDIIAVLEAATLLSGPNAASITASLRAMLEKGQYNRRLAKIGKLYEILETGLDETKKFIEDQISKWAEKGMTIDVEQCAINVKTTSSWIISSATFGSATPNRTLLSMGDINRFRWRSYLPSRDERIEITSQVGSLPPVIINSAERKACAEAWKATISNLKQMCCNGLVVSRTPQAFDERKNIWTQTMKEIKDEYPEFEKAQYFNEMVSLRYRSEFMRLMYQHAALKQFARDSGHDFSIPDNFILDDKEDGEFAKKLWIEEYIPSIIDVVNDIMGSKTKSGGHKITKTAVGEEIVLNRLERGKTKRDELVKLMQEKNISPYLLDNQILPGLIEKGSIAQIDHGWYDLKGKQ